METSKCFLLKSLRVKDNNDCGALESKKCRSPREGGGSTTSRAGGRDTPAWEKHPFLTVFWIFWIIACLWLSSVYRCLSIAVLFIPLSIYIFFSFFPSKTSVAFIGSKLVVCRKQHPRLLESLLLQMIFFDWSNPSVLTYKLVTEKHYKLQLPRLFSPWIHLSHLYYLGTADGNIKGSQLFFPYSLLQDNSWLEIKSLDIVASHF